MNVAEMHVSFRQYAQQMGMQNVRAILPEQIDLLLNTSITDTINQLIQQNIGLTNDRVITDNSKISQINSFRTLYTVVEVPIFGGLRDGDDVTPYLVLPVESARIGKLTTDFEEAQFPTDETITKQYLPNYLFLVDLSINYKQGTLAGVATANYVETAEVTNYFPVRLIDDAFLADTLNDFVLKPRLRSPIAVVYNVATNIGTDVKIDEEILNKKLVLDLYIDKFKIANGGEKTLINNLLPYKLRMSFIKRPNVVKYAEDIDGVNVDCDLPESLHVDIVKHAVDLYRVAVNGSLYASQQQEQQQQRENTRNNYRNDGYGNPQQQQ